MVISKADGTRRLFVSAPTSCSHRRSLLSRPRRAGSHRLLHRNRVGRNGGTALDVEQDGAKVNLYEYLTLNSGEHLRWKFELEYGKLVGAGENARDRTTIN